MKVSERERQSKRMGEEGGKTQKTERVEGAFECYLTTVLVRSF